ATTEAKQRRTEVEQLRETRDGLLKRNGELTNEKESLNDKLAQTENSLELATSRNTQLAETLDGLQKFVVKRVGAMPSAAELRDAGEQPPPPDVEGIVTGLDQGGQYVQISLGEDDGLRKGHVLNVWRYTPEATFLGKIKVSAIQANTAVAKPISVKGRIQENDRVGARVVSQ
ncbi:MAG: hypothetical protein ACRDD1_08425, partial [Planctomycetia bacterium]